LVKIVQDLYKRFTSNLKNLEIQQDETIAIACSGGPDSMALALLLHTWNPKLVALTVDHGLRKESLQEAKLVLNWLRKRKIKHVILTWEGKKPGSNIQEHARNARYKLLADYCKAHTIRYLFVAHTLEDQAETFLLRLARGSGVDGLSAMAAITNMHGISLVRPLLDISKTDLLHFLDEQKQKYISDPSNENIAFARVKMRKLLPQLAEVGLTPDRLAKTTATMARARECLETITDNFLKDACQVFPEGYATIKYLYASDEITLRALALLVMQISGQDIYPRLDDLERLKASLNEEAFKGCTLGGCIFKSHKGMILIMREPKNVEPPIKISPGDKLMWDGRFEISSTSKSGFIGALTQEGWLSIARMHKICNPYPDKKILYNLPTLRDKKGKILAVPQIGFQQKDIDCKSEFILK
jgi:tRNA(Ile)-lysidine synthase